MAPTNVPEVDYIFLVGFKELNSYPNTNHNLEISLPDDRLGGKSTAIIIAWQYAHLVDGICIEKDTGEAVDGAPACPELPANRCAELGYDECADCNYDAGQHCKRPNIKVHFVGDGISHIKHIITATKLDSWKYVEEVRMEFPDVDSSVVITRHICNYFLNPLLAKANERVTQVYYGRDADQSKYIKH